MLFVMAYCNRGTLYEFLHNKTVDVDPPLLIAIVTDVAFAMKYLHEVIYPPRLGTVLRPVHLLMDNNYKVHLTHTLNKTSRTTRAAYYLAPEILNGNKESLKSDVYAFSIFLYEVLYRQEPYEKDSVNSVLQAVLDTRVTEPKRPDEGLSPRTGVLYSLMRRCWHTNPNKRPNFGQIFDELQSNSESLVEQMVSARKRSNAVMETMLPHHIVESLSAGKKVEPTSHDCVTVFFSDIFGFTSIASRLQPIQVMHMLDRLYSKFDELVTFHNLKKIETAGDSFMVVSGLSEVQLDHTARVGRFALDLVQIASTVEVEVEKGEFIQVRAGFHSGPVVASVVGTLSPRYCLFGDAVNLASRMESTSEPGRVQMTSFAAELLLKQAPDMGSQVHRRPGVREVKGKGPVANLLAFTKRPQVVWSAVCDKHLEFLDIS